jgi:hypothetical protein
LNYRKLVRSLRPNNWGELMGSEPFEEYKERVGALLPNWPEGPLQDWLHRHYPDAVHTYGWLRFDRMAFLKETWTNEQIYGQVSSHIMRDIEDMGANIYRFAERQKSRLMRYFLENGTWPVPIILLNNRADIADPWGKHYGQPYTPLGRPSQARLLQEHVSQRSPEAERGARSLDRLGRRGRYREGLRVSAGRRESKPLSSPSHRLFAEAHLRRDILERAAFPLRLQHQDLNRELYARYEAAC